MTTHRNKIPQDLHKLLTDISNKIPICILSSKDLNFLYDKVQFARIVSTLMGIETIELDIKGSDNKTKDLTNKTYVTLKELTRFSKAISRYSITKVDEVLASSKLLKELSNKIVREFQDIRVEHKFTHMGNMLAGITLDYRHIKKWSQYKTNIEPYIINLIRRFIKSSFPNKLHMVTYSDHPFIDVYAVKYDKGLAVESITRMLNFSRDKKILYLGDSENDNPAFNRADLSIGIRSDTRLNTRLDSDYVIEFNELRPFLQKLIDEDFVFNRMSENII
jgi:hydroxymethylpyrimidine pyrophosphatase-like HAD family hydrolase